jgi:hypothetical protein
MKTSTKVCLLFCLVLTLNTAFAQENSSPSFRKNGLSGSLGFAGIVATATSNYERILTQSLDKGITATFAKVGLGTYGGWVDSGSYLYLQYGFLTGKNANHLEVSAGPNFNLNNAEDMLPVAFNIGYRLQKPGKGFMLRTGVAFPETLYLGLGWSF